MPAYRKYVDENCKDCGYDSTAMGNWRQQIELCRVFKCPMYPVRPVSSTEIRDSILDYYRIPAEERSRFKDPKRPHELPAGKNGYWDDGCP